MHGRVFVKYTEERIIERKLKEMRGKWVWLNRIREKYVTQFLQIEVGETNLMQLIKLILNTSNYLIDMFYVIGSNIQL